jgi:hypothetical protein
MATKYIVNNVTGQTINGQQILPYKVYTALLTQSGGDDPQQIYSGLLNIGTTYKITNNDTGLDMTNVGAPNNNIDTYFVATGTVPNSWGEGALDLNTGAPIVTVLENTIGNVWFTYDSIGTYIIKSDNLFIDNTALFMGNIVTEPDVNISCNKINDSTIYMYVAQANNSADGELTNTPIEIRVYN